MPSPLAARTRRRARGLVVLLAGRLQRTRMGRTGRWLGGLCAAAFVVVAVMIRLYDGADASLEGLVVGAGHLLPWLAGGPLALAAASDRGAADRRDGIDALAASRGVPLAGVAAARVVAAMLATSRAIGVPLVFVALVAAVLGGQLGTLVQHLASVVGAVVFAVVAGVTLGGLGALASRLAEGRGRLALAAIVVGPWALADLAGHPGWSLPGAFSAVIDLVVIPGVPT